MNIQFILKSIILILGISVVMSSCSLLGGSDSSFHDLNPDDYYTILESSSIDTFGSYTYEYWNQNETGNAVMGLRDDGSFIVEWDGIFNMLARNGIRPGQNVTEITYSVENYGATRGNSYLCVYGWFYNGSYEDLVEYYIVEDWKNWNPGAQNQEATFYGEVEVGGAWYDLYTSVRTQQPSINGTATFTQYWSIRRDTRNSGTIDVPAHFTAWENAGLQIGETMHEVSFCVEGYGGNSGGSGYANVTELSFSTN